MSDALNDEAQKWKSSFWTTVNHSDHFQSIFYLSINGQIEQRMSMEYIDQCRKITKRHSNRYIYRLQRLINSLQRLLIATFYKRQKHSNLQLPKRCAFNLSLLLFAVSTVSLISSDILVLQCLTSYLLVRSYLNIYFILDLNLKVVES